jgi:hypothetical protein
MKQKTNGLSLVKIWLDKVIAVGNPVTRDDAGETIVYVFEKDCQWTQIGTKILRGTAGDGFGAALALSEDGKRVAVGAPRSGFNSDESGSVTVFQLTV